MRLSFIVGVSSSPPGSQSPADDRELLDLLDPGELGVALVDRRLHRGAHRSSSASSSSDLPSIPIWAASAGAKSASSTISAVLYGRPSPITHTWPIIGPAPLSVDSMFAGDMFLPAALMMISFLRSTIVT